jgi:HlyD family secretion protein
MLVIAAAAIALVQPIQAQKAAAPPPPASKASGAEKSWQAVAPGLVEPRSGEIRITAPVIGRVSEVLVNATDKVAAGELLIRLDDEEAKARVTSARDTVALRKRARNDQAAGKAADRRKAEDGVADAEEALVDARDAFDNAATGGSDADLTRARTSWTNAKDSLTQKRATLRRVEGESGTPLPTVNEGQLNVARSELSLAYVQLEKLRIRAPLDGAVLQVNAKVGELAAPASTQPLIVLGDLSTMRVRAELDERDVGEIKVGQQVVVRADAFPGREFAGKVTAIAPIIQSGRINPPGSRNLTDFSVTEVRIDLADPGPLVVGMKVDVYFQPDNAVQ